MKNNNSDLTQDKQNSPASESKQGLSSSNKLVYVLLFIVSTIVIILPFFFQDYFAKHRALGLIEVFVVNFFGSATIFIPTPSIFSVGIAGSIYNPVIVALIASIASSLGEVVGFSFGYSSREVLNFRKHKILYFLNDFIFKKYGTLGILLFSFIPNPLFDGIGILVGLSSYPLKKFLLLVFIGRFFRNLIIAYIGANL